MKHTPSPVSSIGRTPTRSPSESIAFVWICAALGSLAGCASASPAPDPGEQPDGARSESALVRSCPSQCAMDYSACFQFSDGDLCGCYPSYVSCMRTRCHLPPAIEQPDCSTTDTGVPDTAPPADTADPCPVECHCPDRPGLPPAPACTNTCAECKAACQVPNYQPCG